MTRGSIAGHTLTAVSTGQTNSPVSTFQPSAVVPQLDGVPVGIAHIEAGGVTLGAEQSVDRAASDHVETTRGCERGEIYGLHDETHVIHVHAGTFACDQVDDRLPIDAQRRERRVTRSPLVD